MKKILISLILILALLLPANVWAEESATEEAAAGVVSTDENYMEGTFAEESEAVQDSSQEESALENSNDDASENDVNHYDYVTVHNPLYDGIEDFEPETGYNAEDSQSVENSQYAPLLAGTPAVEAVVCKSEKEVLDIIRQKGLKREKSIKVDWYTTSVDTTGWFYDDGSFVKDGKVTAAYSSFLSNLIKKAYTHTGNPKEGDSLRWGWYGWSTYVPTIYGDEHRIVLYFEVNYRTTSEEEAEVDTELEKIYGELKLDGKNDYEIIKAVYDYVTANVKYDSTEYTAKSTEDIQKYSLYAAVIKHKCVCQGYSLMIYRMLLDNGIDCRLAAGTVGGVNHGWNLVNIGNKYYELDSTWDAGRSVYSYFLLGSVSMTRKSHIIDSSLFDASSYDISTTDFVLSEYKADSFTDPDETAVEASGVASGCIKWYLHEDGTLSLVGSGTTVDYIDCDNFDESEEYTCPWEAYKSQITSVNLIGRFSRIGTNAFAGCSSLANVYYDGISGKTGLTIASGNDELSLASWQKYPMDHKAAVAVTCTTDGNSEYWYCKACNKYFKDENGTDEYSGDEWKIPAGHDWNEVTYEWNSDHTKCTATHVCKRDEKHVETGEATVTSAEKTPATCTEKGWTTYTAKITLDGVEYTDTKDVQDISAKGHDYADVTPTFIWDGYKCKTATFKCNDCTHLETVAVTVISKVTQQPTVSATGIMTYTATCTFKTQDYTDVKSMVIPKIGDANGNGVVNIVDAQIAYDIACGKYKNLDDYESMCICTDVDGDGEVTTLDARAIQYYVHYAQFGK